VSRRAIGVGTDQVGARHARPASAHGVRQVDPGVAGRQLGQQRLGFGQRELGPQFAGDVDDARYVHQEDQLVGTDRGGGGCGDILDGEVEDLPVGE
jgi:hypothetical protein